MGLAVFRDISLLWLIFLTIIAILPIGVIFFFLVKGMHRLRQLVKRYAPVAQDRARQVADVTEQASAKVSTPIIAARAKAAQADGAVKAILPGRKQK
jgi:hypothetical protein